MLALNLMVDNKAKRPERSPVGPHHPHVLQRLGRQVPVGLAHPQPLVQRVGPRGALLAQACVCEPRQHGRLKPARAPVPRLLQHLPAVSASTVPGVSRHREVRRRLRVPAPSGGPEATRAPPRHTHRPRPRPCSPTTCSPSPPRSCCRRVPGGSLSAPSQRARPTSCRPWPSCRWPPSAPGP